MKIGRIYMIEFVNNHTMSLPELQGNSKAIQNGCFNHWITLEFVSRIQVTKKQEDKKN